MEKRCVRIRLKPGTLGKARAWAAEVNSRKTEALSIIKDESVTLECAFLDETANELIYFMRGNDLSPKPKAELIPNSLGAYHHQFKKDCWESVHPLEQLIDLDASDH